MFELDMKLVTALGVIVPLLYQAIRYGLARVNVDLTREQVTWGALVFSALVGVLAFWQQSGFVFPDMSSPDLILPGVLALLGAATEAVLAVQAVYHLAMKYIFDGVNFA